MSRFAAGFVASIGAIFAAIGIGFLVFTGLQIVQEADIDRSVRTEGTIIAAPKKRSATVEFRTADGQVVQFRKAQGKSSSHKVGDRVAVFYDPRVPAQASVNSATGRWMNFLGAGVIGVGFIIVGLTVSILTMRRYRQIKYLMRHGLRLEGTVVGFEQETRSRAGKRLRGRRTVWFVVVDWTDQNGKARRERSDMLNNDPSKDLSPKDVVPVLVDPKNAELFWVDLFSEADLIAQGNFAATTTPVVRR